MGEVLITKILRRDGFKSAQQTRKLGTAAKMPKQMPKQMPKEALCNQGLTLAALSNFQDE